MMQVMNKYWYMLMPMDVKVEQVDLVASTAYISLPGKAIGTTVFNDSGLNDATFGGTYTHTADLRYVVQIDDATSTPNTFKWSKDGGTTWTAITVNCAVTATTLDNGVTVTFLATTGHTLADEWQSDCATTNMFKILRIEVAEDRKMVRQIEVDELFKYSASDDHSGSSDYFNIHYLSNKADIGDFPEALRPLIAIEAVIYALTKDRGVSVDVLAMKKDFESNALVFLSTQQPYEPAILGDYEVEDSYTSTNPVAWCFRDGKIYLFKHYSEG